MSKTLTKTKICQTCGKQFAAAQRNARYCGGTCRVAAHRERKMEQFLKEAFEDIKIIVDTSGGKGRVTFDMSPRTAEILDRFAEAQGTTRDLFLQASVEKTLLRAAAANPEGVKWGMVD